jgi:hypothetical protein
MKLSLAMVVSIALAGSCHYGVADIPDVPDVIDKPTYTANVYPLFRDHCLLCHGYPPDRGALSRFRVDVYDDTTVGNITIPGAHSYGYTIVSYVLSDQMPPAAKDGDGVGPNGKKMLQNWRDNDPPFAQ